VEFRTISHEGLPYVVSTTGEGPDIVLLHGFPDTPYSWGGFHDTLVQAGWRVSVPWLRGYHPDTLVPGRGYDPETLGRDGLGLLDALGLSRTVLFGHDWGALIAYNAAALAPERVRAIVTSGIPHPSVLRRTPAALWAVRHFIGLKLPWAEWQTRRNNLAYLDKLYTRWSPNWSGPERDESVRRAKQALSSPETLSGAIDYYRALPLNGAPIFDRIPQVPGLVIGADDSLGQRALFLRTAEILKPPSRALIVEGAGHWPHREDSALVVPELLSYLSELDV
jgi:pimeloyl-ACP methyl ester carboxylesterase